MRKYSQYCPVARTLDLVGDRWTLIIIRDLFMGLRKFREFRANSPGLPPKVLSARLKMLMEEGMVEREVYSQHPLRAEYRLSEKGESLLPVILAIGRWGMEYMFDGEPEARAEVARIVAEEIPGARQIFVEAGIIDG